MSVAVREGARAYLRREICRRRVFFSLSLSFSSRAPYGVAFTCLHTRGTGRECARYGLLKTARNINARYNECARGSAMPLLYRRGIISSLSHCRYKAVAIPSRDLRSHGRRLDHRLAAASLWLFTCHGIVIRLSPATSISTLIPPPTATHRPGAGSAFGTLIRR